MQITLDTATASPDDLTALIALFASLGGRLPTAPRILAAGRDDEEQADRAVASSVMARALAAADALPVPPTSEPPATDSAGMPWDARIHSESKALNADGSWRKRRGVDDATVAAVTAELTATAGQPVPNDAPPPPPPVPAEVPSDDAGAAPAAGDATPPPPPPEQTAAASAATSAFSDFPAFVSAVSRHGKSYAELNELANGLGVAAFKDMKDHPDKWDLFWSMIG